MYEKKKNNNRDRSRAGGDWGEWRGWHWTRRNRCVRRSRAGDLATLCVFSHDRLCVVYLHMCVCACAVSYGGTKWKPSTLFRPSRRQQGPTLLNGSYSRNKLEAQRSRARIFRPSNTRAVLRGTFREKKNNRLSVTHSKFKDVNAQSWVSFGGWM